MDAETKLSDLQIISQYILSAYMLGARFGGEPTSAYLEDAAITVVSDLRAHHYAIVAGLPT